MGKVKVTYVLDDEIARATRLRAAKTDRRDSEIVEDALREYLGIGLLERLWATVRPATLEEVVEEQHRAREEHG
jgi:predicted transcriptional regulator